ncbi:DNA damage-induced apoptosis suppressor protein [Elgaria multicarinata webbii]|uniref:DNA damage-induced apoptosis suppressor protein n=1 Tax=Elgaria multicarinata webbii TaxID=159646 RepID=UPI002FCCD881
MNGRRLLVASVISVQNSSFVYPSCQNCFSKLFLDLKRYSCLKCGCSGDTKEANYRYRLSLEVADIQDVFEVTVFGSCLDVYFGVTAKGLQRYIEELNQEAGEPDRDATPGVVFQAVETCFIGKKFVFGVKGSGKPDGASSLQNNCRTARYSRALTACQMFIPNSELVGCTVIQFLQQRRCSRFKHSPGLSIWPPDLLMAFDQLSTELSSLYGPGDLAAVPSSPADGVSSLWPQSFRLTSSSVSSGTKSDLRDLNSSQTAYERQKGEDRITLLLSQPAFNPQDHNLTVNRRNEQEDKKCHLYTAEWGCGTAEGEPESYCSLGRKDCGSLQSPLESEEKDSSSQISIQHSYGLEKSWDPLLHQRHDGSLRPLPSSSSHARTAANSLWDELPSSESLNEFIARIENDKTGMCSVFPGNEVDEFNGYFDPSSPKLGFFNANFKTEQADEELQKLAGKVEICKKVTFPCHRLNLHSSISSRESHQQGFYSSLSTERKEKWADLSSQYPVVLPWSSPAGVKRSHPNESCQSTKEGVDQDVSSAKKLHSRSSSKSTNYCLENPCVHARKTAAHLNCKDNGTLASWRNNGSPCYQLNRSIDLTNIQEYGFSSTVSEKGEVCENERELIPEVQEYHFGLSDASGLLKGYSNCSEGSYNASADLFDVGARGAEATVGMLNSSQAFSAQEGALSSKCATTNFLASKLDANWNMSQCGLSLCNMSATSDQKTSTQVAGSISEMECSLAGTLDFIPNSQSTPLPRPCRQVRLPKGKESILRELPLNKLPWINAKCKTLRPPLKYPLAKRLVSMFLQSKRPSGAKSATPYASDPHQFINGSPALGLSVTDGEEWIPPSEKKWIRKRTSLVRNNPDSSEKSSPSKNKLRSGVPKSSTRAIRVEFTPKSQQPIETRIGSQPIHENGVHPSRLMNESPGFCDFAGGNRSNPTSAPHPMPDASNWSPELFSDHC